MKVVEFNAERGKRWLESAVLLKDADVIILNEMDIGMPRSNHQHTSRILAYHLETNYAWGLEFIKLMLGNKEDRQNIDSSEHNFHGLYGSAFLAKCTISNGTIFRDNIGPYFSHKSNGVNGRGFEKRLGGRMILLGSIMMNGQSITIGSTHKYDGSREDIIDYIGSSRAIIAGDQSPSLCKDVGLELILSDKKHYTWPATCNSFGRGRGDNICSNMKIAEKEYTVKPCVTQFGVKILLSDHALTWSVLEF